MRTAICIILSLIVSVTTAAFAAEGTVRTYDIIVDGRDIGDFTVTRKPGTTPDDLVILGTTDIAMSGLLWSYELSMSNRYEFNNSGITVFDHTIIEDGKTTTITGKRGNTMVRAKVTDSRNKVSNIELDNASFDVTLEGLPRHLVRSQPANGTELRLLDSVEFSIAPYTVIGREKGATTMADTTYDCHIFTMKTPEGKAKYWIAQDDLGPFIVRETGTDDDGPYDVIMRKSRKL